MYIKKSFKILLKKKSKKAFLNLRFLNCCFKNTMGKVMTKGLGGRKKINEWTDPSIGQLRS